MPLMAQKMREGFSSDTDTPYSLNSFHYEQGKVQFLDFQIPYHKTSITIGRDYCWKNLNVTLRKFPVLFVC